MGSTGADDGDDATARTATGTPLTRAAAVQLGDALQQLLQAAGEAVRTDGDSDVARRIGAHLGVPLRAAVQLTTTLPPWQHVSVQRAVDAHLQEQGDPADWFGVSTPHRGHMEFRSMLLHSAAGDGAAPPPDLVAAADGPGSQVEVVEFGLVLCHAPGGAPVVLAVHRQQMHGPEQLDLVVLAADRAAAATTQERLRELVDELDVIRGRVVSFGSSEHFGNTLVSFLPRPTLGRDDVVLDQDVLPRLEDHLLLTGEHAAALRARGLHLKRGVLLHGPPGTGKTHTVRYLISRATTSTVVVLSGRSLQFIEEAATLARRVAPTIVVVEDVDLIGMDRSFSPTGNPLLFSLLDAMDGVATDADVSFVLTTNRPADLEEALVQRPGRIDLAVEVPLPSTPARRALLELYSGDVQVTAAFDEAVEKTEGMTASALKELMRRAALAAIVAADDAEPVVTPEVLAAVLTQYLQDARQLAAALSGGPGDPDDDAPTGPAGGGFADAGAPGRRPMSRAHGW